MGDLATCLFRSQFGPVADTFAQETKIYLSSKPLDIVIDMLDTKLSYMLVDGCENAEELDTVKRCRLALRTARAASGQRNRQHRSRLVNGQVSAVV